MLCSAVGSSKNVSRVYSELLLACNVHSVDGGAFAEKVKDSFDLLASHILLHSSWSCLHVA